MALPALSPGFDSQLPSETALIGRARRLEASPGSGKTAQAAQEFESILLTQWLEQARQAFAGVPGGDDEEDADPGAGQMMSLGMHSLATAVTKQGGIGIARLLTHYLDKQASQPKAFSSQGEGVGAEISAPKNAPEPGSPK
ncbi:MAG TPA: hypothetical protein VE779_07015 [Candidatus Angelobacter sp.]|nr:hypothetical protein [Candidatus Angelobacter sp.]